MIRFSFQRTTTKTKLKCPETDVTMKENRSDRTIEEIAIKNLSYSTPLDVIVLKCKIRGLDWMTSKISISNIL